MQIYVNEIESLDFFVFLVLNNHISDTDIEEVKSALSQWCTNAIEGKYGGHMHFVHSLDYSKDNNKVFAFIDIGSMNPEEGINALQSISEKINENSKYNVISHIELDGTVETLDLLAQ